MAISKMVDIMKSSTNNLLIDDQEDEQVKENLANQHSEALLQLSLKSSYLSI
jgi:hypothetical protein